MVSRAIAVADQTSSNASVPVDDVNLIVTGADSHHAQGESGLDMTLG